MKHKQVGIKSKEDVSKQSFSKPGSVQPEFHQSSRVQHYRNIGNQGVQRMLESRALQAKLKIGSPNDKYEQEADSVADQVMRMEEESLVQRQPEEEEEELKTKPLLQRQVDEEEEDEEIKPKLMDDQKLQRQELPEEEEEETPVLTKATSGSTPEVSPGIESSINTMKGGGQPLSESTRSFFETRFGADFSQVRVHTDLRAAQTAQAINAKAFTTGKDIVFNSGQYGPNTTPGKHLLAHELTHVVQQNQQIAPSKIQCQCSDPNFCIPYVTTAEAVSAEAWLRTYFLPVMNAKFGTEVHDLWENFLSRSPGDSLARIVFDTAGNPIEDSFATSGAVADDQDAVLDLVASRLSRFPGRRLRPHVHTVVSLTNFLTAGEMNNRPINFRNIFTKCGNIAGGIGSSAAGPDYRKIARANVALQKVPLIGNSGYIYFKLIPHYEVYDAVDLCDGQCGALVEQIFTIPLSRLEASGRAFDVPYVVKFQPAPQTKRVFYLNLPL